MNTIVTDVMYDPTMVAVKGSEAQRAQRTAEEVESLFLYQLMKAMDETVDREENDIFFDESEATYRSLFNQELSREIAKGAGIGLKQVVEYEMQQQVTNENNAGKNITR